MATVYEDVIPSLIENTTMQKTFLNGVHRAYTITPNDGYVLHDKNYDEEVIDPMTLMPTGEIKLGYRPSTASCGYNYDFTTTQVTAVNGQIVTAYGSREFYAIPETEVPADQIYGGEVNPPVTE